MKDRERGRNKMRVVVVGAGATGLGVGWDLALRGLAVTVIEQGDIAHGTSGRFHGLLHSGARYVVRDPKAAAECFQENQILRKVAAGSVEPVGGYFVESDQAVAGYRERWLAAMTAVGVPWEEASVSRLRQQIPDLAPTIRRAYRVPDGVINGFELLFRLRRGIELHGGMVRLFTRLVGVSISASGRVQGVQVKTRQGEDEWIACDALVNAAGPFAGHVAELFGDPFAMRLSRGVMLVFAERKVPVVINRLASPGDGDILVPHHRVSIWGTTDEPTDDPEARPPSLQESRQLLALAGDLFPQMGQWRVLRAFAGVRPLYQPAAGGESRHVTRDFTILDHRARGGPAGVVSVVGGKWVTYRRMAEQAADAIVAYLGESSTTKTHQVPLPELTPSSQEHPSHQANLCECEEVAAQDVEPWSGATLNQLRTRTWFSMGPCQGAFCVHRVAATRLPHAGVDAIDDQVQALRAERERGMRAALWGDNAREWALSRSIRRQILAEDEEA